MAILHYKTGRSRRVSYIFSGSGPNRKYISGTPHLPIADPCDPYASGHADVYPFFRAEAHLSCLAYDPSGPTMGEQLIVNNGFAGDFVQHMATLTYPIDYTQAASMSGSGYMDVEDIAVWDTQAHDGLYGIDPVFLGVFEYTLIGGTAYITASLGTGETVSVTTTIAAAVPVSYASYAFGAGADFTSFNYGGTWTATKTCLAHGYEQTLTRSDSLVTSSFVSTSTSSTATVVFSGLTCDTPETSGASGGGYCQKGFDLEVRSRRWEEDYPGHLGFAVDKNGALLADPMDTINGNGAVSFVQRYGASSVTTNGTTTYGPQYLTEFNKVQVKARAGPTTGDSYTLLAYGEDPSDSRVRFRIYAPFSSFTMKHVGSVVVDDGASLTPATEPYAGTWANVANSTLSIDTGAVKTVIAGGVGQVRRRYTPLVDSNDIGTAPFEYRYLEIKVKADAARAFKVVMGTKEWTADWLGNPLTAGVAYATFRIELCSPTNSTVAYDDTDTSWPVYATVSGGTPINYDGQLYGVTWGGDIVFDSLVSGATYWFDELKLIEDVFTTARFNSEFNDQKLCKNAPEWISDTTIAHNLTYYRYLTGRTDNRLSLQAANAAVDLTVSSPSTTVLPLYYLPHQINAFKATTSYKQRNAGWTATGEVAGTDPADYGLLSAFLNQNRPADWARASGAMYQDGAWVFNPVACAAGSDVSIYAQAMVDTIDIYPGAGDAFDYITNAYGGNCAIKGAYVVRGGGYGIVYGTDCLPKNASAVTVIDTLDSSGAGSVSTNTKGEYTTGTPYGRSPHNIDVMATDTHFTRPWYNRESKRLSLKTPAPADLDSKDWIAILRDYTDREIIITTNYLGQLIALVYNDSDTSPITYMVDSGAPCSRPKIWLQGNRIEVTYIKSGAPHLAYSRDHGRSWSMITIPGTYTGIVSTQHLGRLVIAGYKGTPGSGGQWYTRVGKLQNDGTYTWSSEVSMALTNPKERGDLKARWDGVLEFAWIDNSGNPFVARCRSLALDATGAWT